MPKKKPIKKKRPRRKPWLKKPSNEAGDVVGYAPGVMQPQITVRAECEVTSTSSQLGLMHEPGPASYVIEFGGDKLNLDKHNMHRLYGVMSIMLRVQLTRAQRKTLKL